MLKIFAANGSIALASVILLEEVEADYELAVLDFSRNEQKEAAYQAVNPKGRVPALITESGILTETPAILLYIAQRFGSDSLVGAHDPLSLPRFRNSTVTLPRRYMWPTHIECVERAGQMIRTRLRR